MRVRVLAVLRAQDTETGRPNWQVAFGRLVEFTPAMRERISQLGQQPPPGNTVGVNSVLMFHSFDGPVPYQLDSEWELEVRADGSLSLTPASGAP